MRKFSLISLAILLTFTFMALAPQVCAQEDPWVKTYDTGDNLKDKFLIGETVRIKAYSWEFPYTINVLTSVDGGATWSWVKDITSDTRSYEGDHIDISEPPVDRRYKLILYHRETEYSTTYFIIPELPFGTIMAMVASLGAVAGLVIIKRLRPKLQL